MISLLKILETVDSPINGKIQVVETLEGRRLLVGGISQSGWLVARVWKTALSKVKKDRQEVSKVLILGLGGGSAAELVQNYWSQAQITGVEIDKNMVNLGKKYLQLGLPAGRQGELGKLKVIIDDAEKWVKRGLGNRFDLILVDLYVGGKIPEAFTAKKFMSDVFRLLKSGGVAAFNHLYSNIEKEDATKFEKSLKKVFPVLTTVTPEANIIFIAYKE